MRKFTVPCIISLLIAALYNIVEQIFIANAANNVVFPLPVVALAQAAMIGDLCLRGLRRESRSICLDRRSCC